VTWKKSHVAYDIVTQCHFPPVTLPTPNQIITFFLFVLNLTLLSKSTSSLPAYLELGESKRKYEVSECDAGKVNFGG